MSAIKHFYMSNREKWLEKLRDPNSHKMKGRLESGNYPNYRCCMGHACSALGEERFAGEFDGEDHEIDANVGYGDAENLYHWTEKVAHDLNVNYRGEFEKPLDIEGKAIESLDQLNDHTDLTTQQIADVIEENLINGNLGE